MNTETMSLKSRSTVPALLGWLAVTGVAAVIGAIASINAEGFYAQLVRPAWAPPAWLFGPVWSTLYTLMGIAAWRVWRKVGFETGGMALGLYLVQLAANALWSWLFFAWHLGSLAFSEVLILWALIVATLWSFWRHDRVAAVLLVPYLLWVSFAAALTYAVWQRNPALLG